MSCRTNSMMDFCFFVLLALFFSSAATAADNINVVESETGFYYTIQKGDTLWDLSRQFNDSPWLWPELWEENDQISNPHWIFPGERIRLYKKSGTQATAIESVPSMPSPAPKAEAPYFLFSAINRVGFIRKPPVEPSGTLLDVEGKKTLISEGDIVYIRPSADASQNQLIPGSRHTVFRYMAPTDARNSTDTIGTQHYLLGIVEVTQKKPDLVTATVIKSFRTMRVDDLLMPYVQKSAKIELKPSTPGIEGQIVISEEHSTLTGDYVLAFIDKGRSDHIEVGQQYSIYRQQKLDSGAALPPVDLGAFMVLHTEATTSTVVITNASNNIRRGEHFRTPIH
ncbi:LysM peptidoglycan-binding domain-containing protein [Desulfosarcina ovata]|nr:LysM domain-containing protein [Desulfosarcina ovata]